MCWLGSVFTTPATVTIIIRIEKYRIICELKTLLHRSFTYLLCASPFLIGADQPVYKIFRLDLIKIVAEIMGKGPLRMSFEDLEGIFSFPQMPSKESK